MFNGCRPVWGGMRRHAAAWAAIAVAAGGTAGCKGKSAEPAVEAAKEPAKVKRKRVRPQEGDDDASATASAKVPAPAAEPAEPATPPAAAEVAPAGQPAAAPVAEAPAVAPGVAPVAEAPAAEQPAATAGQPAAPEAPAAVVGVPAAEGAIPGAAATAAAPAAAAAAAAADDGAAAAAAARKAAEDAARAASDQGEPAPAAAVEAPALRGTPAPPAEPPLDVTGFLTLRDIENAFGPKRPLRRADLPGVKPDKGYNYLYFAPERGDDYGVSLQIWRDPNIVDSRTRYNTLKATASNALDTGALNELAFRSYFGGVVGLTFVDGRQPIVAVLACSTKLCKKEQLIGLARIAAERLK